MELTIKVEFEKAIEKVVEIIVEMPKYSGAWWTAELTNNIVKAIEIVVDQNEETQTWLRKEGYLKD